MPLFSSQNSRFKTYSKTRHKDIAATTAFDNLIQEERPSQSSFLSAIGNFKISSLKSKPGDRRSRSDEDIFLIRSDDDRSSTCKQGSGASLRRKAQKIGDCQSEVKEKVALKQFSQELKSKGFLKSSVSKGQGLLSGGDSNFVGKHDVTEEQMISQVSQKQKLLGRSRDITALHQPTWVRFEAEEDTRCPSVTEENLLQMEVERKSDCKEVSLNKEDSEKMRHLSSHEGVFGKVARRPVYKQHTEELPSVQMKQFEYKAKVIPVDKQAGLCLKTCTANKNKQQASNCHSDSFVDFTKSNSLVPLTQGISTATGIVSQKVTGINQHFNDSSIPNTSKNCNSSSGTKVRSPEEHKLQAKTFVNKLSQLFAGKKSLVNESFSCVVPTTHQNSFASVESSVHRIASHKASSLLDISLEPELKDSVNFRNCYPESRSVCSMPLTVSSNDFRVNNDSSQTLPLDDPSHACSGTCIQRSALPSVLQEHDYSGSQEQTEDMKEDHSYSLLSSPRKFTIPGSTVVFSMDSFDKPVQKSDDSITPVDTQPLSVPITNCGHEETNFLSKQLPSFNLHEDSDLDESSSVLLLSPLPETPLQNPLPPGKLTENVSTDSSPLRPGRRERRRAKNTKDMIMLKQKILATPKKNSDIINSLTFEELQGEICETLGDSYFSKSEKVKSGGSALTCGKNDPVQDQCVVTMEAADETLTEDHRKQFDLQYEKFSFSVPMSSPKNSTETFEPFSESNEGYTVSLGKCDNQDSTALCNNVSKASTFQGRSTATNSTKFHSKFIRHAAEQKTFPDAVCCDLNTTVTQSPNLTKEGEKLGRGTRARQKTLVDHHAIEHGQKRTKSNQRQVRRGNDARFQLRNRTDSCAVLGSSDQLIRHCVSDDIFRNHSLCDRNEGLAGTAKVLSKRTSGGDDSLMDVNAKQQKLTDEVTFQKSDCEATHQSSVRRLLKSPHKASSKAKAVYNPRQWHDPTKDEVLADCTKGQLAKAASALETYDFSTCDNSPPVLTRVSSWPKRLQGEDAVKVRVATEQKPLFTVVRNVKGALECQEYGETQEFQDDVDYILDGLQCSQPLATRCLSTLSLASKCLVPAFRMHLRAHGILIKILEALHDAPDFTSLSLCLSAFLFTMSCDRLTVELDDFSLRLILRLIDSDSHDSGSVDRVTDELERIRLRVFDICVATIRSSNTPRVRIKLSDITTSYLGMELLLSLTAKQTADWFKESLRSYGGLSHIMNATCQCIDEIVKLCPDALPGQLDLYARSEKCLKVLDNVTYMCKENQSFIIEYKSSKFITALGRLLKACVRDIASDGEVASSQSGRGVNGEHPRLCVSTCLLALLRLLLNITHEHERGCFVVGQQQKVLFSFLMTVLCTPATVCAVHQFDLSILGLSLLMNFVENCEANRKQFIRLKTHIPCKTEPEEKISALESLGMMFSQSFKAAQAIEEVHDAKMESAEKQKNLAANFSNRSSAAGIDQSGQWVESESGLQWVAEEEKEEELKASSNRQETPLSSQDDTDNYTRELHTAGQHMEDSIMAAYIAALIGSVIQHDVQLAETVRDTLPEHSFSPLVRMLRKFLGFMNFTNSTGASGSKTFQDILKVLESHQLNAVTSSTSLHFTSA